MRLDSEADGSTSAQHPPLDHYTADFEGLYDEAVALVAHPRFDDAMRSFCTGLSDFHARGLSRSSGVVDTVTWAVVLLVIYLDATSKRGANASQLVAICADGGLAGATAVRNAIAGLRHAGLIVAEEARGAGRSQRLRASRELIDSMIDNLAVRLGAIEPVIAWPKPAARWAHSPGVLQAFVGRNVEAYRRERLVLFESFPEVRNFMDRRSGYHLLLEALSRLETTPDGAEAQLSLSVLAEKFEVSRAHVRKLFAAASARGWLRFEPGGRLSIPRRSRERYRLWIGYEFAWTRRLVAAPVDRGPLTAIKRDRPRSAMP